MDKRTVRSVRESEPKVQSIKHEEREEERVEQGSSRAMENTPTCDSVEETYAAGPYTLNPHPIPLISALAA